MTRTLPFPDTRIRQDLNMPSAQAQEKILKEYEKQGEVIMKQMLDVYIRARRKVDDEAYRKVLEKLERETN